LRNQIKRRRFINLISKNSIKIGLGALSSSILVLALLASCGGGATVTQTVGGGAGSTVTTTATTTVTSPGGGTGGAMSDLVVYGDLVSNIGCLDISAAHRGELIVFRNRIVDPKTGKDMVVADLKSVTTILPDGQKFTETFGGHPGGGTPTDYFWSYAWEVPLTYPMGTLGYQVVATANDGRTGTFSPFVVSSSQLSIVAYDPAFLRAFTANITATGFSVATLTISQGATVTFTNKDTIPHIISAPDGNSPSIAAAGTYKKVFSTAGTFVLKDAANPAFTITINVNAAS
jgi:plastocyanin